MLQAKDYLFYDYLRLVSIVSISYGLPSNCPLAFLRLLVRRWCRHKKKLQKYFRYLSLRAVYNRKLQAAFIATNKLNMFPNPLKMLSSLDPGWTIWTEVYIRIIAVGIWQIRKTITTTISINVIRFSCRIIWNCRAVDICWFVIPFRAILERRTAWIRKKLKKPRMTTGRKTTKIVVIQW